MIAEINVVETALITGQKIIDDSLFLLTSHVDNRSYINPCLNHFYPLEVVSRYRDPQVDENYSYLLNLKSNICICWCLNTHFVPNNIAFRRLQLR